MPRMMKDNNKRGKGDNVVVKQVKEKTILPSIKIGRVILENTFDSNYKSSHLSPVQNSSLKTDEYGRKRVNDAGLTNLQNKNVGSNNLKIEALIQIQNPSKVKDYYLHVVLSDERGKSSLLIKKDGFKQALNSSNQSFTRVLVKSADKKMETVSFSFPVEKPKHLSVFAVCYLQQPSMEQRKTGFKNLGGNFSFDMGTPASLMIIDGGEVVSAIVQDHRKAKETKDKQFRIKLPKIEDNEKKKRDIPTFRKHDYIIRSSKNQYFGNDKITRTPEGSALFLFDLDFRRMIAEECLYARLMNQSLVPEAINRILLESKIASIDVLRRRVRPSHVRYGKFIKFSDTVEDKLLVSSGDGNSSTLVPNVGYVDLDEDGEEETFVASIREVDTGMAQSNNWIRRFTGADSSVANITNGKYQYYIRVVIKDGTYDFLSRIYDGLNSAHMVLNRYREEGLGKSNYDYDTKSFSNKHIQYLRERYHGEEKQPGDETPPWVLAVNAYVWAYMSLTTGELSRDRLAAQLMAFVHPKVGSLSGIDVLDGLIHNLMSKISNIIQKEQRTQGSKVTWGGKRISKNTMEYVFEFHDIFDSDIPKDFGIDYVSLPGDDIRGLRRDGVKRVTREQYEKRCTLENLKYYKTSNISYKLQTKSKVYVENDNLSFMKYAYLSPSRIKIPGEKEFDLLNAGKSAFQGSEINKVLASFQYYKQFQKDRDVDLESDNLFSKAERKMAFRNMEVLADVLNVDVSIVLPEKESSDNKKSNRITTYSFKDIVSNVDKTGDERLAQLDSGTKSRLINFSTNVLTGLNSRLVNIKKKAGGEAQIKPMVERPGRIDRSNKAQIYSRKYFDISEPENFIEKHKLGEDEIKKLPNQIKSQILSYSSPGNVKDLPTTRATKKSEDRAAFDLNYGSIAAVEMITDYERDKDGFVIVNSPKWSLITAEALKSFNMREIVCRIRFYEDPKVGSTYYGAFKDGKTTIYNDVFLLESEKGGDSMDRKQRERLERKNEFVRTRNRLITLSKSIFDR